MGDRGAHASLGRSWLRPPFTNELGIRHLLESNLTTAVDCYSLLPFIVFYTSWSIKTRHFIRRLGIAMPKGLYFTAVVFSFLFFRGLISDVTERISTKLGHIFTYDCYLKNLVRSPTDVYPQAGGKNRFFGPTSNFDQKYLCSETWYQQSKKSLVNLQGLSYMPPNLVNFGPQTAENGWRVFLHTP